jgi:hypothetical protein
MSEVFTTPVSAAFFPVTVKDFSAITGVANSIETTVLTYTSLGNETISDIIMGGTSYARFNIYLNTVLSFVVRSGPNRQANFSIQRPLQLATGDVVDVKVIHYNLGWTDDFEATLLGV